MSDHIHDASTSRPHVPEWMAGAASDLLKNFARYQTGFARVGLEMQAENFSFLQRRYEADTELAQTLMKCRKPREILSSCMDFYQHALDDYSQEAVRFSNIGTLFIVHAADPPDCLR